MKSFSTTYVLLAVIIILALYVIGCVGLAWLPTIGHCCNAQSVNTVLLNLSYSYIASIIFYVVIDLVPRWSNERKAFFVFNKNLSSAYMHMNKMVGILKMMAGTEKTNDELTKDDFASLNICSVKYKDAYVELTLGKGKEQGEIDCYAYLKYHATNLRNILKGILEFPASSMLNTKLITLLIETKQAEAVSTCSRGFRSLIPDEADIPVNEFDRKIIEFITLYEIWGKFFPQKNQYTFSYRENGFGDDFDKKLMYMLNSAISKKIDVSGISETHYNLAFLCYYALPEKYKALLIK